MIPYNYWRTHWLPQWRCWFWLDRRVHKRRSPMENIIQCLSPFLVTWGPAHPGFRQHQGFYQRQSSIYNPRSNGLAERAEQTAKKALMTWNSSLRVTLHAFLARYLFDLCFWLSEPLVVESSSTPEIPIRRSARVRQPNSRFNNNMRK